MTDSFRYNVVHWLGQSTATVKIRAKKCVDAKGDLTNNSDVTAVTDTTALGLNVLGAHWKDEGVMTPVRQMPTWQLLDYDLTYQVIYPPRVGAPIASYDFNFRVNMSPGSDTTVLYSHHDDYHIEPV